MTVTIYYLDACTSGFMKRLQQLSQSNKRSLVDAKTRIIFLNACADPEGGGRAERPDTPPPKYHKNTGFACNIGPDFLKNQANIQCWAINGVLLASR